MVSDFISLIFPDNCASCNTVLFKNEKYICVLCRTALPLTNYHKDLQNPLIRRFWGKVDVEFVFALYKFIKGGNVQNILYNIKYNGMKNLATELGLMYGRELYKEGFDKKFDLIIPVPLHKNKQRKRGYNQSEFFAKGLSESMGIEMNTTALKKSTTTTSQTLKSRMERWVNVNDAYGVENKKGINQKKILLVDDVITTGATIEVCAKELLDNGAKSVGVAAIACAQ